MERKNESRKKITFDDLVQTTLDEYFKIKSSRHEFTVFKIREILMAFTLLSHPVRPSDITKFIRDRSKRFVKDSKLGADIKSQIKYYLKELVKIKTVERDCDGYYRLAYKVIPSLPEDIEFHLKRKEPDPSDIVSSLDVIINYCERLKEHYLGDES